MEQPANPEPPSHARMVHSGSPRLGLEFYAGHRSDPHGPGISFWSLQVSARADLGSRNLPAANDVGDGLHRPGAAIRPGRLLGVGNRTFHLQPRADHGSHASKANVGGTDYCGRHSLAFFCIARLRDSRLADWFCWTTFAVGPEARDQRVAYAGPIGSPLRLHGEVSRTDAHGWHAVCA